MKTSLRGDAVGAGASGAVTIHEHSESRLLRETMRHPLDAHIGGESAGDVGRLMLNGWP
jgi:microcompartment protein CcmK/EutM